MYPTPRGYIILGTTFMQKYYIHFDYKGKRIGLAEAEINPT
jgi:hypothetical protein